MKNVIIVFGALLMAACCRAQQPVVEWSFKQATTLKDWQANSHLTNLVLSDSAISFSACGTDPILELRSRLNFRASPWNVVEIRLQADRDGLAELFWSNTDQGRFGGFEQEKSTRFAVKGDRQWHTYRLLPFWQKEGKIVRLRFDVYDAAKFQLASIRIVDLALATSSPRADYDFVKGNAEWRQLGERGLQKFTGQWDRDGLLLGAAPRFDAASNCFVSLCMSVDRGHHGTLIFATEDGIGLQSRTFQLQADGQEHTYNLDLRTLRSWRGTVIALGLEPSDHRDAHAQVRCLQVANHPQGPAQLKILSFAPENPLPRVGKNLTLVAQVSNTGGEPATNINLTLTLPQELSLQSGALTETIRQLGVSAETIVSWTLKGERESKCSLSLAVSALHTDPVIARANISLTRSPRVESGGYVPRPRPVRGPYEVGVYYFPGWKNAKQWEPIRAFPERKPVLGWYREGDPEIADWHIKWAVEHGITFFAYDWYWDRGRRQLEHALHDGYFKARYRSLIKFCLLWANHNPAGSSSLEDCREVTRYWIEHYFRQPEHLTLEGRPVVIIFSPQRFTEDLGAAQVKLAFDAMRRECVQAGLKGLYLIACVGDAGGARQAAAEGYDSVTAYNWPGLGMDGSGVFAPYEGLLEGYRQQWESIQASRLITLTPVPVNGGWDSRPWHGENNLVRFGRTPELFQRHLEGAKKFLDTQHPQAGSSPAVIIEAWNEWGEGSYLEPHAEFGFGYLEAIRKVFGQTDSAHDEVTPTDVGLGPYDVAPMPASNP
jgi:uncharacterized repeat protein (TIGR01451 family)